MAQVLINETTLTSIGDAIRVKEGTTDLVPVNDMATRITNLPSGGGGYVPTDEDLTLSGTLDRLFWGSKFGWLLTNYGNRISTKDVTSLEYFWYYNTSGLTAIPFAINCGSSYTNFTHAFNSPGSVTECPVVLNAKPKCLYQMFANFSELVSIPEDFTSTWDWTYYDTNASSAVDWRQDAMFSACHSLRNIPTDLISHTGNITYSYCHKNKFCNCYALEKVEGLGVTNESRTWKYDGFDSTFQNCHRLSKMTFQTNEDGTPKTVKWTSQVVDLSYYLGFDNPNSSSLLNYGFTEATKVTDQISYAALKDNPDWWTDDINYSRYNYTSALETINSLPDTSAYGTNTIKFTGDAGSLTDGGAISNLTEEEIAVATAKGWTVTLV